MSSRYDPVEPEPTPVQAQPAPLEPVSKSGLYRSAIAVGIVAAIGIAAVFNFDLCGLLRGVGVTVQACADKPAPAPAPATSSPAQ